METSTASAAAAESLRLKGNDAFSTKDWERATDLYHQSLACDPASPNAAKVYSNLAATFCKVGRYEEAAKAAERCTSVDPEWAKGWWRRGTVANLQKDYTAAIGFYRNAYMLEKTNKQFVRDMSECAKKMGGKIKAGRDGWVFLEGRPKTDSGVIDAKKFDPGRVVWNRIFPNGFTLEARDNYIADQMDKMSPSSEQYIASGLIQWYMGMTNSMFRFIYQLQSSSSECKEIATRIDMIRQMTGGLIGESPTHAYEAVSWAQLGGVCETWTINDLAGAFVHLGGQYIVLEFDKPEGDQRDRWIPIPPALHFIPTHHQQVAINNAIHSDCMPCIDRMSRPIIVSEAVSTAIYNNYKFLQQPMPGFIKIGTPKKVIKFCKLQLREGVSWDEPGGILNFISIMCRGGLLFAIETRIVGMLKQYYDFLKWIREFIDLADSTWHVRRDEAYDEKGSCFRSSFQINILCMEFMAYNQLRGPLSTDPGGPYPLVDYLLLLKKARDELLVIKTDVGHPYQTMNTKVAFLRKPTSKIYSSLASCLKTNAPYMSQGQFHDLLRMTGHPEAGNNLSPNGIIAEFYRKAAEAELPDDDYTPIYWWGFASNMCEADESDGFSLKQLRFAVKKALDAQRERAADIFGPDKNSGGSYENIARIVVAFYQEADDDFILPKASIIAGDGDSSYLEIDGEIICKDFDRFTEEEQRRHEEIIGKNEKSRVDRLHGEAEDEGIPSLSVLCIRSLHKQDMPYARGESDASSIILKAMQADNL